METLMKADIFFAVTTIAIALIAVVLVVALVYLILFLRDVTYISKRVKEESDEILQDVSALRLSLKSEGSKVRNILGFVTTLFHRTKKRKPARAAKSDRAE